MSKGIRFTDEFKKDAVAQHGRRRHNSRYETESRRVNFKAGSH